MGKGKEVKEDERAFIVGMAKGGTTLSKILEGTKRPRGTVATILRNYRLRGNVFQTAKRNGRPPKTTSRLRPSLMIRACMSYDGVGLLAIVNGSVTGAKYRRIL